MNMISLIITIAVVGLIAWAICTYVPMDPRIKQLIVVIAIICIVVYALRAFGVWGSDVPVPKLR